MALLIAAGVAVEVFLPRRIGERFPAPPAIEQGPPRRISAREIADAQPARDKSPTTLIQIAKNVFVRIGKDNLSLVAAGVAFYAMTAIFPAIAAFVSIYGLFADPAKVQDQVASLSSLLPAASLKLLTDALQSYASKSHSTLNFALLVAVALALWSAKAGVSALMTGLNIANEQEEKRSFIVQQVVALALTLGAIVFAMIALAALALLPALIGFLPLPDAMKTALDLGRWPLLAISRRLRARGRLSLRRLQGTSQMAVDQLGRRDRDRPVDHRLGAVLVLRFAFWLVRRHLWLSRGAGGVAAVVLAQRVDRAHRGGNRCGARAF